MKELGDLGELWEDKVQLSRFLSNGSVILRVERKIENTLPRENQIYCEEKDVCWPERSNCQIDRGEEGLERIKYPRKVISDEIMELYMMLLGLP